MSAAIDTHGMTVDFGKHRGERWTRIPVSYLRWIVNNEPRHSRADIAEAELARRNIDAKDREVEISGHAIDSASLRVRKIWHSTRGDNEGLHAWLLRMCEEALSNHKPDSDGRVIHNGMKLVFQSGSHYPTLKTVMRAKK